MKMIQHFVSMIFITLLCSLDVALAESVDATNNLQIRIQTGKYGVSFVNKINSTTEFSSTDIQSVCRDPKDDVVHLTLSPQRTEQLHTALEENKSDNLYQIWINKISYDFGSIRQRPDQQFILLPSYNDNNAGEAFINQLRSMGIECR